MPSRRARASFLRVRRIADLCEGVAETNVLALVTLMLRPGLRLGTGGGVETMELAGSKERTRGSYTGLGGIDEVEVGGAPEINAEILVPSEEGSKDIRDALGSNLISRRGGLSDDCANLFCLKEVRL